MSLPGDGAEVVIAPKRSAEDGRGGFVLRAKSDEMPHRDLFHKTFYARNLKMFVIN